MSVSLSQLIRASLENMRRKYCCSGMHDWSEARDAELCCNGWIRVLVPMNPDCEFSEVYLVPEGHEGEAFRRAKFGWAFESSTVLNPWLGVLQ